MCSSDSHSRVSSSNPSASGVRPRPIVHNGEKITISKKNSLPPDEL